MDERQQNLRRAAAEAFMESLGQLEQTLQPAPEGEATATVNPAKPEAKKPLGQALPPKAPPPVPTAPTPPKPQRREVQFSLDDLEQAAKDIEQYMQQHQAEASE